MRQIVICEYGLYKYNLIEWNEPVFREQSDLWGL